MRSRGRLAALLAAALIAAPAVHAQQPEPSLPDQIGEAIRGFFQSIFGAPEGVLPEPRPDLGDPTAPRTWQNPPPPPQNSRQAEEPKSQQPKAQEQPAPAAKAETPAVAASPSAAAVPLSLHSAIAKGDYANALKMIEQGTDLEAKDPGAGASPLHYAVMKGEMPLVGMLVQRGADVNSRTKSGTTPLHTAVLYGRFEVAEYLLDKGSDVNAKSASGATPLSLADTARFQRIGKLLRERGAR